MGLTYGDLLPARGEEVLRLEDLLHPAVEDEPQIIDTRETVCLQVRLDGRRTLPHAGRDLVASHVDVAQGHARLTVNRHELADHALDEAVRRLECRVHHVVVIALGRGVHRAIVRVVQPVLLVGLHRLDRGARVARHLDFGNHLDVPRRRIAQDLEVVRAGIEAAAPRPVHVRPRAKRRRKMCS